MNCGIGCYVVRAWREGVATIKGCKTFDAQHCAVEEVKVNSGRKGEQLTFVNPLNDGERQFWILELGIGKFVEDRRFLMAFEQSFI